MASTVGRALTGSTRKNRWRRLQAPLVVGGSAALLGIVELPPLFQVGRELFASLDALGLLLEGRLWWLLLRSLLLAGAVTAASAFVGVPLGVLFARATLPFRRALFGTHLAIAFLPPFLPALGWFHLFGSHGLVGGGLSARLLFSDLGAVLVQTCCFAPIVTALTALGVRGVDASLEDAGRIAAGPVRTAVRVLVPCAAPVISLAGVIVFALAFSELGVPMFLRVDVYPAVVFARLGGMDFAPGEAAVFVLPLVFVAAALLAFERRFAGRRAIAALGGRRELGGPLLSSRPALILPPLLAAVASAAPIVALIVHASTRGGFHVFPQWLADAPFNGLRSCALAAIVMAGLAVVLGRELARRSRAGAWSDAISTVAFLLPSSILGVGIMLAWNHRATGWFYGSFGILVVGFVARYNAVATRTFAAALTLLPPSLDDAARTVGASYIQRLALMARMAPQGLVGAFVLALVFGLRDLETAALYYPPGGEPLTVRILTLEANGPPAVVSALAMVHVTVTLAVVGFGCLLLRAVRNA
jgi:iron(III) transport system permease protein